MCRIESPCFASCSLALKNNGNHLLYIQCTCYFQMNDADGQDESV